jgi:tetratricopeptide (TPR) repeat protein
MEHWGIDTFFSISITAAEHMPEIADRLFSWPVFVDDSIFHDYAVWKSVPVLLTGNTTALYPWRQKVFRAISERYPSLACPHGGYSPRTRFDNVLVGERYARTISASWFVPTCGTVAKEVVRKHFEIPACGACLITEDSAGLTAAGFVDMENCVFADAGNVVDRLKWLDAHPDRLQSIIDAGSRLVHARHTLKKRDQILQWFLLRSRVRSDERIIQLNPFEAPVIVERSTGIESEHVISGGAHLWLLARGDAAIHAGRYDEAQEHYTKCANYLPWMPEPKVRIALCSLYRGDPAKALGCLDESLRFILDQYRAVDPDPVEWAYRIVALLCLGRIASAAGDAGRYPQLFHPTLYVAQWACTVLRGGDPGGHSIPDPTARRATIHVLPERSFEDAVAEICLMLQASGKSRFAALLQNRIRSSSNEPGATRGIAFTDALLPRLRGPGIRPVVPVEVRAFVRSCAKPVKRGARWALHGFEKRFAFILPYRLSAMREDEFFTAVHSIARREDINSVLSIGRRRRAAMRALVAGIEPSSSRPPPLLVAHSRAPWVRDIARKTPLAINGASRRHPAARQEDLDHLLAERAPDAFPAFDLVLLDLDAVDEASVNGSLLIEFLQRATFVLLENTTRFHALQQHLRRDSSFRAVAENPGLRRGYAIYQKLEAARRPSTARQDEAVVV